MLPCKIITKLPIGDFLVRLIVIKITKDPSITLLVLKISIAVEFVIIFSIKETKMIFLIENSLTYNKKTTKNIIVGFYFPIIFKNYYNETPFGR